MLFAYSLILDGVLGKIDGCLFLLVSIVALSCFIYIAHHAPLIDYSFNQIKTAVLTTRSLTVHIINIIVGLIILPISAKYVVAMLIVIAKFHGLSELTIGLTIVAIGTTLPELATALMAALKGEEGLAAGIILALIFITC